MCCQITGQCPADVLSRTQTRHVLHDQINGLIPLVCINAIKQLNSLSRYVMPLRQLTLFSLIGDSNPKHCLSCRRRNLRPTATPRTNVAAESAHHRCIADPLMFTFTLIPTAHTWTRSCRLSGCTVFVIYVWCSVFHTCLYQASGYFSSLVWYLFCVLISWLFALHLPIACFRILSFCLLQIFNKDSFRLDLYPHLPR